MCWLSFESFLWPLRESYVCKLAGIISTERRPEASNKMTSSANCSGIAFEVGDRWEQSHELYDLVGAQVLLQLWASLDGSQTHSVINAALLVADSRLQIKTSNGNTAVSCEHIREFSTECVNIQTMYKCIIYCGRLGWRPGWRNWIIDTHTLMINV